MRLAQNTPVRAWYVKPCINQYRADWLKNCAMRDYKKSIRTNWIWCTRYILPRQQLQRQNTRIELTTKAKRADFLKLKKFLWEKLKKRMTLICGLAIILPIYAIQNQELPEVEMFCRHTIGGYQFLKFYEILLKFMMNGKY